MKGWPTRLAILCVVLAPSLLGCSLFSIQTPDKPLPQRERLRGSPSDRGLELGKRGVGRGPLTQDFRLGSASIDRSHVAFQGWRASGRGSGGNEFEELR